jgi:hypothetical protein
MSVRRVFFFLKDSVDENEAMNEEERTKDVNSERDQTFL